MLNYPQISMQLKSYVEAYNRRYSESSSFQDVHDNTQIYNQTGLFINIMRALIGSKTGEEYKKFDALCCKWQASKLSEIDGEEANELWQEFLKLYDNK